MEEVCSICHKHLLYVEPISEKKLIPGMCNQCKATQDQFLTETKGKEKRIAKYLLEGGTKPSE